MYKENTLAMIRKILTDKDTEYCLEINGNTGRLGLKVYTGCPVQAYSSL